VPAATADPSTVASVAHAGIRSSRGTTPEALTVIVTSSSKGYDVDTSTDSPLYEKEHGA
jgi:hypothetical protein